MAVTIRAMRPLMPPSFPSISAARCACSICATKASPGTRRAQPRSIAVAPGLMDRVRSSPTRTSPRRSRGSTATRARRAPPTSWRGSCSVCRSTGRRASRSRSRPTPSIMERASPLRSTHLRDPYGPPILFGSESFIDEMAAATNSDPVDFRLRYLTNPRDRDAVRIAAESYGWQKRPSPRNDQKDADVAIGRGIAFRRHFTTFIGLVAEVRVHKKTGKIDLLRYVCAHDVGMIVNPETLKHVIDRQLVYGTSRAMLEEVRFDANMVTSVDWETYPVLHTPDLPEKI